MIEGYMLIGEQMCGPRYFCGYVEDDEGNTVPDVVSKEEAHDQMDSLIEHERAAYEDEEGDDEWRDEMASMWVARVRWVDDMIVILDEDGDAIDEFNWKEAL